MNDHQAVAREILNYIEGRIPLANSRDEQQAIETIAAILARHYGDLRAAAEPDIVQSLAELATIAGNFWDDIDPDEYISTLRSEFDTSPGRPGVSGTGMLAAAAWLSG